MFNIVASDLDGTLLNQEHTISSFTRDVLQRLHQQNTHFVFATGRHHIDVAHIRQNVGIPAMMITSNGARVHDENDQCVFACDLSADIVIELIDMVKEDEKVSIHIYSESTWYVNRIDEDIEKFHKDSGFSCQLFDPANPPVDEILKVFFINREDNYLIAYEEQLRARFGDRVYIAFSTPFCLEVMAAGVSKGAALEAVAKLKGLSLNDCIAFGDGMNDVEMLQAAKKGLVMATAHPRVKAALPNNDVIGSHADDAVAHYLAETFLSKTTSNK